MAHFGVERRRTPRVEPTGERTLSLEVELPVEVVDISLTGLQLASKVELAVGDTADLRATVGSKSVLVTIEIRRVALDSKTRGGIRYRAGAVFTGMTEEQRLMLEQMLGTEPS